MPTPTPKKPLILVDGSSYLFRAYHALPPLTNSKGQPTGAIYGVINMLRKLIKGYQPDHIAVVFDPKGKTFRDDLYEHYKANREETPQDLQTQIPLLYDIIQALGLPMIIVEGVEADDVIGTLARQALELGMPTIISTGDKDFAQLVNDQITLINTMTNKMLDRNGVQEKFGVPPALIIDYLALVGDNVDNIPGIPGVGPKTAAKWLQEYGSLAAIIERAAEIKGKVGDNLRENITQLPLAKQLATIKQDVTIPQKIMELIPQPAQQEKLIQLFKELEFKSWLSELLDNTATTSAATSATTKNYHIILTAADFSIWLKKLMAAKLFAFDTETTSLNAMQAEIVGVSFAIEAHQAAYIPLAHDYLGAPQQLNRTEILKQLKPVLENPAQKKIGQNAKYDMKVLAHYGINLQGIAFDTMLESYVLNSTGSRHDMDTLALKYLGQKTILFEEIAGKGARQITFNQVPVTTAGEYAAEDADITLQLHECLYPKLAEIPGLKTVFETIEMPLVPVLARVECNGVLIDAAMLKKQSQKLEKRLHEIEEETYRCAGITFNLGSPKQLQEILFNQLKLPVLEKTPGGQASTAESVLEELARDYPLPKLILEHRSLSKLKSTYTDRLPEQIDPHTGRVHTSLHQAVTSTGRLSSSDPNLQNIPIRTEAGRAIRKAFIAPPGYKILAADYSQIELRIMAHLSQDPGLLKAFANNLDIHKATAAEVFMTDFEQVSAEQRRHAKAINFGLIYGMSSFGLSRQLDIERNAAQEYMNVYFTRYPGVKVYMERTREQARKNGYVETLSGRRLYLPEITSRNFQRQKAAERAAINAPMQGTAADIIKLAMIHIDHWLSENNIDARMILQVHDELVFEIAENHIDSIREKIRELMGNALPLTVPLVVDIGVGDNWDEAH